MRFARLWAAVAALLIAGTALAGCGSSSTGNSDPSTSKGTIVVASPQCAHCLAMTLLTDKVPGYDVKVEQFGTLTGLAASLAAGKIDVGQIDYTGLVSMIDKGLPLVAISGQVNGGSDFVVSPSVDLDPDDWAAFKDLVLQRKAEGKKFKIASEFGSVQDIELRLQLPEKGIDANQDVEFVNVPYQGMAQALQNGSVDAAIPVQPIAATITNSKIGVHFAYPYDQAAGDLTNVVVVNKDWLAKNPDRIEAVMQGMNTLVPDLSTPQGQKDWAAAVEKYTGTSSADTTTALAQLKPDIAMPFSQIKAIAHAMYEQNLISTDLSVATLKEHIDYGPLSQATGKTPAELGAGS
ncbi:ABC transporter substrate-binding protein [Nocardioides acrostichi]|uniref:ABC transporter substrate-binding protein n=1 Tax=Nocardioides acrostichi TaxID=2784339 RepID=A0A930V1F1_9ACTN|nr:ABC transporter substrate-binding protein [Nocardioides acrostichi]MBF4161970.1 ABC transporter substrate-binding protein [Nocardioides acrostichi]